jgi:hypothetical protein
MTSQQIAELAQRNWEGYDIRDINAVQLGNTALLEIAYQLAVANEREAEGNTHAYELGARHEREKAASAWLGILVHPFTTSDLSVSGRCEQPGCGQPERHPIHGYLSQSGSKTQDSQNPNPA